MFVGNTGIVEQKLLHNELDVGLVEGHVKSEDLIVTPVIRDQLMLVCSPDHPYSRRESVTGSRGRRRRSSSHSGPNTSGRAMRTSTS